MRGLPRILAPPAADVDAKLLLERAQTALQSPDYAGRDAGRMPVHSHHSAERLKPERVREAPQELIASVVVDDRLADHRPETGHSLGEPHWHLPAMQR